MEISHSELHRFVSTVDDMHRDAMTTFVEETAELHLDATGSSRRRFITGAALGGAALSVGSAFLPVSSLFAPAGASAIAAITDADMAAFAESLELAAFAAYGTIAPVLSAATIEVATVFASHHQAHAEAFARVSAGKAKGKPNAKLVTALTPALSAVKDEAGALEFAFVLENQTAETYAFALTVLMDEAAYTGTATILPIESAHAGVLAAALGKPLDAMFPTGAFMAAEVGDGTDIKQGIDPDTYPIR
jgi:hypothetical protein